MRGSSWLPGSVWQLSLVTLHGIYAAAHSSRRLLRPVLRPWLPVAKMHECSTVTSVLLFCR